MTSLSATSCMSRIDPAQSNIPMKNVRYLWGEQFNSPETLDRQWKAVSKHVNSAELWTSKRYCIYVSLCFITVPPPLLSLSLTLSLSLLESWWLRKMTRDPYILVHITFRADRYTKLKICVSELYLDSYKYLTVAYVTKYCMILP